MRVRLLLVAMASIVASGARADVAVPAVRAGGDDCDPAGKRVVGSDVNGDHRPDFWRYYRGNVLTCRKSDMNYDGRPDVIVHYRPGGEVWLEEYDFDFDGRIDMWRSFTGGKLACEALDSDGDGAPDTWTRYDGTKPVRETTARGACASLAR